MKTLLLLGGLLACSLSAYAQAVGSRPHSINRAQQLPSYQLAKVERSQNVLLSTAQYRGVLLNDPGHQPWHYGLTARTVSPEEVIQAERILAHCTQQGSVNWYWYKLFKDPTQQSFPNAIYPLSFYLRQYKGLHTEDGQRVVWINAFPKRESLSSPNWQTIQVVAEDGGRAYFNIFVNLDTQQCFNFFRNSIGG